MMQQFTLASAALEIALALVLAAAIPAAAEPLYRCTGGKTVLYTDQPCGDGSAPLRDLPEPVTIPAPGAAHAAPGADTGAQVNVEVNNNIETSAPQPPLAAPTSHGLEFRDFRRLERGQSEAKVLAIAGPPDRETLDAVNTDVGLRKKSYYYISTGHNASITRIRFTNGNVTRLDRELRPY